MADEAYDPEAGERVREFEEAFFQAHGPIPPGLACPITWSPSALVPVFYGVRDYTPDDGAPVPLRVFFPSLDGEIFGAPILVGCGHYPLILFAHGQCANDPAHYKRWFQLPAQLARSGYVVVVPELANTLVGQHPATVDHPEVAALTNVLSWMRSDWEHKGALFGKTGICGHSFGSMLSARIAGGRTAYVSLSGRWGDWFGPLPIPIGQLDMPMLFIQGGEELLGLSDSQWNGLATPRHRVVFVNGMHWDYLPHGQSPCDSLRGSCKQLRSAVVDLVTMFFAKYVPPELAPQLPGKVPNTLIPPKLVLTEEQEFYAGGHLIGYKQLAGKPECEHTIDWKVPKTTVPHVRFLPAASAKQVVLEADLVPEFTGLEGPNAWVFKQSPLAGKKVDIGSTVKMLLSQGEIP